ncbi:MAG: hypothetical protein U9R51_10430, partial [Actinomycetota bacterium]|nr:hypothetical protein [Actinomycetota bacterium]
RGIRHLQLYNIAYYVAYTDDAKDAALEAGLTYVAIADPWVVFTLPSSDVIEVAEHEPSVWNDAVDFTTASLEWYDDVDNLDRWMVADGPEEWRRITSVAERLDHPAESYDTGEMPVRDVLVEDHRISFTTTAIGVPHVVKVSYFPNWKAAGADGPFRAAPSLMVVIPTSEEVVLTFEQTWVEFLGKGLTSATLLLLAVWWYRAYRGKRSSLSDRRSIGEEAT